MILEAHCSAADDDMSNVMRRKDFQHATKIVHRVKLDTSTFRLGGTSI